MTLFSKKTGDYNKPNDPLGKWNDSLVGPVVRQLGSDDQNGLIVGSTPIHPHLNLTTKDIVRDLENLVAGRGVETKWVREILIEQGYDPEVVASISGVSAGARIKLHNLMVERLRKELVNKDLTSTIEMLLVGNDTDVCLWMTSNEQRVTTTCGAVRAALLMSVEEFMRLPKPQKLKVAARVSKRLLQQQRTDAQDKEEVVERTKLHQSLATWARGPLKVERPNGSSLHHLIDYDAQCTEGTFAKALGNESCQIVIVEHDWSGAVPPTALGEWHLPFELICWEFRISGVRILAFTDCVDPQFTRLWLTYGRDGRWVSDDYNYLIGDGMMVRKASYVINERIEFARVAQLVHDCIRSACIMMDAQIVKHEHVAVSKKLNERRVSERKVPLRDHYVVRLIHSDRRAHIARSRGASASGTRSPQRGHWRIGTWVHYDDPDSGSVQYANDGGFIVSKSWRRWHFAGDPNNIITKEYRV